MKIPFGLDKNNNLITFIDPKILWKRQNITTLKFYYDIKWLLHMFNNLY